MRARALLSLVVAVLACAVIAVPVTQGAPAQASRPLLDGRGLIANMHGLLFHAELEDLAEDVRYADWLGARVIRVFATDGNHGQPWTGEQVGTQIARLAPELRAHNIKLIVALVNNHQAVPGEVAGASGRLDNYKQLLLPFFTTTWHGPYLYFARGVLQTVRSAGAQDVVGAWEVGNELHTPQDPAALIPFVTQVVGELRALDSDTPILLGTMGANHVEPGTPDSPIARWLYCEAQVDAYTLHAYDWVGPERPGDMPIEWDLDGITAQPCPNGRRLPVIVEELGTSRGLAGAYAADDEATRLVYELRQIRRALRYPQVVGLGVWNAESPRVADTTYFDNRRGLTSYGAYALGGGSCYDPRPDRLPGARCQYEMVLRQLAQTWPDVAPVSWQPLRTGGPVSAPVVGVVDPPSGDETVTLTGWLMDTAHLDDPFVDRVNAYLGSPQEDGLLLATASLFPRPTAVATSGEPTDGPPASAVGFQVEIPGDRLPRGVASLTLTARTRAGDEWARTLGVIVPGPIRPAAALPTSPALELPPPSPPASVAPPRLEVISPAPGSMVRAGQILEGIAYDAAAPAGTGIDRVDVFLDPGRDAGGRRLGTATLGLPRPGAPAGSPMATAGFRLVLSAPPGSHTIYVYAHSALTGREAVVAVPLRIS